MALTVATFRTMFPAFTEALYPDARVQFWIDLSVLQLNVTRWGTLYEHGQGLFVGHNLTMEKNATAGGPNAGDSGLVSSKTIGPLSKSMSQQDLTFQGAGNYNLTWWGREFYKLAQMIGAGGGVV